MLYCVSQNVLLRHPAKSGLKVIDFGSSCFEHEKGEFCSSHAVHFYRIQLFPLSVYLYPKPLLPVSRSHSGLELPYGYRHVESRVHSRGAVHGLSYFPWRE